jgi:hypothetical protein
MTTHALCDPCCGESSTEIESVVQRLMRRVRVKLSVSSVEDNTSVVLRRSHPDLGPSSSPDVVTTPGAQGSTTLCAGGYPSNC